MICPTSYLKVSTLACCKYLFQEQRKGSTFTLKHNVLSLYAVVINSSFGFALYFVCQLPDLRAVERPAAMQAGPLGSKIFRKAKDLFEWLEEIEVWGKSHFSF